MNKVSEKPPSIFRRLHAPAIFHYLVMAAAGLLVYFFAMSSRGNDGGALIAVLIAIAGILARWSVAPVFVLLLTTYLIIDPGMFTFFRFLSSGERIVFPRERLSGFQIDNVLLAAGILAYMVGHFRLTSLLHQGMPVEADLRVSMPATKPATRDPNTVPPDELPKMLFLGAGCVVVGQMAWFLLVVLQRANRAPAFTTGASRMLILIWCVGVVLLLISAALVYLNASTMSPPNASLILRDEFFQENRRETDRLQRWRKWYKEKLANRRRAGR